MHPAPGGLALLHAHVDDPIKHPVRPFGDTEVAQRRGQDVLPVLRRGHPACSDRSEIWETDGGVFGGVGIGIGDRGEAAAKGRAIRAGVADLATVGIVAGEILRRFGQRGG